MSTESYQVNGRWYLRATPEFRRGYKEWHEKRRREILEARKNEWEARQNQKSINKII